MLKKILKAVGVDLSKLQELVKVVGSFNVKIDRSVHIHHHHVEGDTLYINPDRLSGKQKHNLKAFLRKGVEETGAVLEERCVSQVEEVLKALPCLENLTQKLIPIIPPEDVPLLKACLFLREKHKSGQNVDNLKAQIVNVYGMRGRNFSNLCSAGYLEDWMWPTYQELSKSFPDASEARARFLLLYNTFVNELPWTEFISSWGSLKKLSDRIVQKMEQNSKNGIFHLNVHALGKINTQKVDRVLPDIVKRTGAKIVRREQESTRIFIRLEMPRFLQSGPS